MNILKSELPVGVDVDDTLLMWKEPTIDGPGKLPIEFAGKTVYLTPHTYHVDLLKMYKARGYYIIVWSANGWEHAERAVIALGIEDLVSGDNGHIQTKLCKHMDDNPNAESILGPRVYCADLTKPGGSGSLIVQGVTGEITLINGGMGGANTVPNFTLKSR